jgi:hypothetical protein
MSPRIHITNANHAPTYARGGFRIDSGKSSSSSGPPPFTPADLPGLILWLDAADAATINGGTPANNDPVDIWRDKSGLANDCLGAGGTRPLYQAATTLFNGKPSVLFTAASLTRLEMAVGAVLGTNFSAWFVYRDAGGAGFQYYLAGGNGAGSAGIFNVLPGLSLAEIYDGANYYDAAVAAPANADTSWVALSGGAPATSSILKNWAAQPSAGDSGTPTYNMSQKMIGTNGGALGNFADGRIAALAIGAANWSAADLTKLQTYSLARYGV